VSRLVIDLTDIQLAFNKKRFVLAANRKTDARQLFMSCNTKEAFRIINERAKLYSSTMGIKYRKLNITNAISRWGSCSQIGNISFTWRWLWLR
jgi:hypothetical protein